jgi:DNA repair exonuclease SbcCD nuclease subunit
LESSKINDIKRQKAKMKILHSADIHLKEYKDERWKTLEKLVEIGKKEKIQALVISGDLFDKNLEAESLKPKIRELFSGNNFKILLIPGNHDQNSYKDMYFGEDVTILNTPDNPFKYEDIRIWGIAFEPIGEEKVLTKLRSLQNKLSVNHRNILLYHGELLDAFFSRKDFGDEGKERYMPVKLSYFKGLNIDYVLAGHFHSNFDIRRLEDGGYFIYPGSPVSITKRETGKRKVNIFEVGNPPKEYIIDSPYFEELTIELDPIANKNPLDVVKEQLKEVNSQAKILLTVRGYINSRKISQSEAEFASQIRQITENKCLEEHLEFQDIHRILEDDLFKSFLDKLNQANHSEANKKQICNLTIKAMMEALER